MVGWPGVIAAGIFLAALALIASERIHRTKAALVGAAIVALFGLLEIDEAVEAVDWETLGLLIGMMILVALTERTGVFTYVALRVAQLSKGRPLQLIFLLAGATGVLSAFLDNLTAILLVVPVTLLLADMLRIPAVPLVLVEIFASNIGGTATLIGDPPNIMIGTHVEQLSFLDFIVVLAPISALVLVVVTGMLYLIYRGRLQTNPEAAAALQGLDPMRDVRGRPNVGRSLLILGATIVGFFLHAPLHLSPAVVAMSGATALLLVAADDVEEALERVEWATLFFFAGLFVMVGALSKHGVIGEIADAIGSLTGDSRTIEAFVVLWGAAVGSAVVDNIPFTAAMIPVVDELQGSEFHEATWWSLALGACFGGNATLIAAAANVAAAGVLERSGARIRFGEFALVGIPVTLVSLLFATAYVWLVVL
jgi:Na+/H+ antiporter NhaD/arsenite permease-like protein